MLYVYFGTDVTRVRQSAFDFLQTLTDADNLVTKITTDVYQEGMITDLAEGVSLFLGTQAIVIDTLSEDAVFFEDMLKHLETMGSSANNFIVIEKALNAAQKKIIQKYATHVEEGTLDKKERFNAFLLTDALLRRDKKSLWMLLMEAREEGLSNEEVIGLLFWQVKILRLVERTKTAEEAGQKPFVYSKAKRALSNFKKGELDTIFQTLLTIYHEGHMGRCDTSLAIEKWVLWL